mmetsp:Transcript_7160/g.44465  ORF Transcript_7160/g.44465 Transcript_7160/m.44465 type:complete len:101 (+) Transcript_7160:2824-3126(+)
MHLWLSGTEEQMVLVRWRTLHLAWVKFPEEVKSVLPGSPETAVIALRRIQDQDDIHCKEETCPRYFASPISSLRFVLHNRLAPNLHCFFLVVSSNSLLIM